MIIGSSIFFLLRIFSLKICPSTLTLSLYNSKDFSYIFFNWNTGAETRNELHVEITKT